MNFTNWWNQNKTIYEKLNITKEIAHTIWMAACDNVEIALIKNLK